MKRLGILFAAITVAATAALAGPPWISVELPANPFDRTTRGAFIIVHTYHHDLAVPYQVVGTAEGLVNGQRRSVPLTLTPTGQTGAFAIAKSWSSDGVWVLTLGVDGVELGAAVGVGADGQVAFVRVPVNRQGFPRNLAHAEVELLLRALAAGQPAPALQAAGSAQ